MTADHARRAKIRSRTRVFLAVANRVGIEKIEAKIVAGFLTDPPCHRSRREVRRQLRSWVDTNPDGRHANAIPAARDLYETLFAQVNASGMWFHRIDTEPEPQASTGSGIPHRSLATPKPGLEPDDDNH